MKECVKLREVSGFTMEEGVTIRFSPVPSVGVKDTVVEILSKAFEESVNKKIKNGEE